MILKVQDPATKEWIYFDHVRRPRVTPYGRYKLYPLKDTTENEDAELVPTYVTAEGKLGGQYLPTFKFYDQEPEENQIVRVVGIVYDDRDEENGDGVAFTGEAYLLNDEGKTIEKL